MNKSLYLIAWIASLALFAGCSDYLPATVDEPREAVPMTISFTLPAGGNLTRAASLAGEDHEKFIDTLAVYMFDSSGKYEEGFIIPAALLTTGVEPGSKQASITLAPEVVGSKHFYFLANVQGVTTNRVGNLNLGISTTTEAQFMLALQHLKHGFLQYRNADIALPMYGTSADKSTEYIAIADVTNLAGPYKVRLVRSVARFDIVNDKTATGFEVQEVSISGARSNGLVYPAMSPYASAAAVDTTCTITNLTDAANGTAKKDDSKPEFYLLPTHLNDSKTQIWLNGIYTSPDGKIKENRLVKVIPPVKEGTSVHNDDIVKNHIYMIQVDKAESDTIKASLVVDDWDERDGLDGYADMNAYFLTPIGEATFKPGETPKGTYVEDTNGVMDTYTNTNARTDTVTQLKFTIGIYYTGVEPKVTISNPLIKCTNTPYTFTTTPYPCLASEYTITFPIMAGNVPMENDTITIRDSYNNALLRRILVTKYDQFYAGTTLKAIQYKGLIWAPVNVGATTVPATLDGSQFSKADVGGYGFQFCRSDTYTAISSTNPPLKGVGFMLGGVQQGVFSVDHDNKASWGANYIDVTAWTPPKQGPCPFGWHVPTKDELQKLVGAPTVGTAAAKNQWVKVIGDDPKNQNNPYLYIPGTGVYDLDWANDNPTCQYRPDVGVQLWSCNQNADKQTAFVYNVTGIVGDQKQNNIRPVRCVTDIPSN